MEFMWFFDFSLISVSGVQLELRIPGNTTTCTISDLEAGLEYNINVFAVINNSISVPDSITVWTCKWSPVSDLFRSTIFLINCTGLTVYTVYIYSLYIVGSCI